jgi:hypothetical protein
LILALTIFPTTAFALAELDDARERLIDSALDRVKQRTQKTDPPDKDLIGTKWWVAYRRSSDPTLKTLLDNVEWFKIAKEESGFFRFEYPNGRPGGGITREGFEKLVKDKVFVPYDPAAEIAEEIRKEKAQVRNEEAKATAAAKKAHDSRIARIKAKQWPLPIEQTVIERKVQIGMTAEQVTMAWGKPSRINRSVGRWGEHEQWVYGSTYLYFENGILDSLVGE